MPQIPLYEIPNARQHAGEPLRRWFYSNEQDLYAWTDEAAQIVAFQLCYGKLANAGHSALHWHRESGFKHLLVEEGSYGTPLLVANSHFDKAVVIENFRTLSAQLPADITAFVLALLEACPIILEEVESPWPSPP